MELGDKIKACRLQAHLSQEKVAELVGVSRQAVTKWESGQSSPNTENLFKLAEVLGTTVDFLIASESNTVSIAEQVYQLFKADEAKKEAMRRAEQKAILLTTLAVAGGYLAIFLTAKLFFTDLSQKAVFSWLLSTDPKEHSYLFGWLISHNRYLISSLVSILPALLGKRRFSLVSFSGFSIGLPLGELLGENKSGTPFAPNHYGWAIWGGIFLISWIMGIILEKFSHEDIHIHVPKFRIWLISYGIAILAILVLVRMNMF